MTYGLPDTMRAAIREEVQHCLQAYGAPRADLEELRHIVMERVCNLTADDRDTLALLLGALAELRPGIWVQSAEVYALAPLAPGPAGEALRLACRRFAPNKEPVKALGKFMARAVGVPTDGGLFLRRVAPPHRRDAALYCVAGFRP